MTEITLKLDDSRRLTGINYFCDHPGAVLDAFVSGIDKQQVVDVWLEQLATLLNTVGWQDAQRFYRIFEDGVSLGFAAPIDALYAATDINEAAWESACQIILQDLSDASELDSSATAMRIQPDANDSKATESTENKFRQAISEEQHPELLALITAAEANNTVYLVDDDTFSLGYGASSQTWEINALPAVNELNWQTYQSIPIALVTGTNGKSTSVRLTSQIIKQAGLRCGVTSTDFIRVGDTVIDKGDYSGPGGARMLLRHLETEAAVLEVARGGLLRRGLPIPQVDAALVTNVAEDHLGQYGINSVAALTAAKMMVAKAVSKELVLNADDDHLVAFVERSQALSPQTNTLIASIPQEPLASSLPNNITWFSLDENNSVVTTARANLQNVCFVRDGQIIYATSDTETSLIDVTDIPMTLNGAAVHNVQNALGAVALSKALNIDDQAITIALSQFKSDETDNPGRGNLFDYQGAKIMLDFAHNVHSMDAMANTLRNMPAARKILLLCHAGDRSDQEVDALTHSAMAMQPDLVWVSELPDYLRGREPGAMPLVIANSLHQTGFSESAIQFCASPLAGAEAIMAQLQGDDLVFIMALSHRDEIAELLKA